MSNINIKLLSLHQLDVAGKNIDKIDIDKKNQTIINYVENLINEILENPNKREYNFKDGDTEIKNSIPKIVVDPNGVDDILYNNAKRLLDKQIIADERIKHMDVEVQKGSLLHVLFQKDENDNILICKVEHDEIINEKNLELNRGLNTGKKIYKACLNKIGDKQIYVSDRNNSKYWWHEFLELEQIYSDEDNTEKSVEKIISTISTSARKKEYKLDSTILRNNVIGYFRSNKDFNLSDICESVFEGYTPYNTKFPIENITEKLKELSKDDSFDKQFSIIPDKIGKRKQNKIKVGPGISLNIEDYVKNLDKIIIPYNSNDKFGMTILTEEAYNFAKEKTNNEENS